MSPSSVGRRPRRRVYVAFRDGAQIAADQCAVSEVPVTHAVQFTRPDGSVGISTWHTSRRRALTALRHSQADARKHGWAGTYEVISDIREQRRTRRAR